MRLDVAAIQAAVTAGQIRAVSLNTNVFDKNVRRLELGVFRHLRQVGGAHVRLVMHDVVMQVMQAQLKEGALETETRLKAASRAALQLKGRGCRKN